MSVRIQGLLVGGRCLSVENLQAMYAWPGSVTTCCTHKLPPRSRGNTLSEVSFPGPVITGKCTVMQSHSFSLFIQLAYSKDSDSIWQCYVIMSF